MRAAPPTHRTTGTARAAAVAVTVAMAAVMSVGEPVGATASEPQAPTETRFSTFNASLNRDEAGQLIADLSTPDNAQASNVAEIVQRVRPAVLLIN